MIRTCLDRLYLYSGYLAGLFLIAIFVLMMVLSAGRPVGINIPAGDDFISWCMAAAVESELLRFSWQRHSARLYLPPRALRKNVMPVRPSAPISVSIIKKKTSKGFWFLKE